MNDIHLFKFSPSFILVLLFSVFNLQSCDLGGSSGGSSLDSKLEVHQEYFAINSFDGTSTCLDCHQNKGDEVLTTGHWNWEGVAANVEGHEAEIHGKNDMINNFCIAVPSNEGRCTQCHIGSGYVNNTFDFGNAENIDCLVCHDQSGTYKKAPTTAGAPDPSVDLLAVAKSVGENDGIPQRTNCIGCHAKAGGGDNVKHGDLSTALVSTTREYDVHMGTDGENFTCVTCHDVKRITGGDPLDHGIGGMPFHSVSEGSMKQCEDCHGGVTLAHQNKDMGRLFVTGGGKLRHQRLACQVCHIPNIARQVATKTFWDWSTAGQDISPIPTDPVSGLPTYDKKKGSSVWEYDVRPVLRAHNGKWHRMMINVNDQYTTTPVMLAEPAAAANDPLAKIYPFKLMAGKQVADPINQTIMVPHLFGLDGGDNPYWVAYDWNLALLDGAAYTGQTYSGTHAFVETEMLLSVNHEIAPGTMALGKDNDCAACHSPGLIDWPSLGWPNDPHTP